MGFACFAAACDKEREPSDGPQQAPSSSVISVGVSLGGCDDVSACERECDAGSADRCRRLAVSYAFGQSAPKDEARATLLYERACTMGDAPACVFAGQMHEYAHGVPKDDAAAVRLYDLACKKGWAAGYYNLAIMYESGHGAAADPVKAADLYAVACRAGAKQACEKTRDR
jgi:TPR repeat protein